MVSQNLEIISIYYQAYQDAKRNGKKITEKNDEIVIGK